MTPADLHDYQNRAIHHGLINPQSMLWIDMGLGKTVICLSIGAELLDRVAIPGILVVAPKRVCQSVWRQEAQKWTHTNHLKFSLIQGDVTERTRAAMVYAQIYLVNYENLEWLINLWTQHYLSKGKYPPVALAIFDEVTKMKNATANRSEAWARLAPFVPRRIGLTGTPASNGYKDLHGQYLAVDGGKRLGLYKTSYAKSYMRPENPMSPFGKQVLVPGSAEHIHSLINDITLQMNAADYIELPEEFHNDIYIELPPNLREAYRQLENEMFIRLDSGAEVESFNAASLTNRCLQYAQGAMYPAPGSDAFETIHDLKIEALESVVEEANGKPVIAAIQFRSDGHRIQKRYPDWVWLDSKMSDRKFNAAMASWAKGDIPGIIAHPGSAGHGLDDLKKGPVDDVVWFGHTWALDLYEQMNGRVIRQGRERPVRFHHLTVRDTVEEAQRMALRMKATEQGDLKAALNEYRNGRVH